MRLVDLHCDWLRQYAAETTLYAADMHPEVIGRVGRLDGYLLGTSLTALACTGKPEDWSGQSGGWSLLGLMLARYESEFTGRIIRDAGDVARWRSMPSDGLCWGMIGVAGLDFLVRQADDLGRLPALFDRGVRIFQPIATSGGSLGGSAAPDDARGLTDLGTAFLDRLAELARGSEPGPAPILDLAGMSAQSAADTLHWLDEDRAGRGTLLLAVSHGTGTYRDLFDPSSPAFRNLQGLRSRGGVIGLTPGLPGCETPDELRSLVEMIAGIPFEGRCGYEGIAIGSDLLGLDRPAPGLESARGIARGLERSFDRRTAGAIIAGNARRLLLRSAGIAARSESTTVLDSPSSELPSS
jgi:membrane dipeptidase